MSTLTNFSKEKPLSLRKRLSLRIKGRSPFLSRPLQDWANAEIVIGVCVKFSFIDRLRVLFFGRSRTEISVQVQIQGDGVITKHDVVSTTAACSQ